MTTLSPAVSSPNRQQLAAAERRVALAVASSFSRFRRTSCKTLALATFKLVQSLNSSTGKTSCAGPQISTGVFRNGGKIVQRGE